MEAFSRAWHQLHVFTPRTFFCSFIEPIVLFALVGFSIIKKQILFRVHCGGQSNLIAFCFFLLQDPLKEQDIISSLPVKDMTLDIIIVTKILSDRGTNALGDFEVQYMYDPRGTKPVEK